MININFIALLSSFQNQKRKFENSDFRQTDYYPLNLCISGPRGSKATPGKSGLSQCRNKISAPMQRYIGEIIRTHQKGKSPQAKAEDQVLGYQIEY